MKHGQSRVSFCLVLLLVVVLGSGSGLGAQVFARVSGTVTAEDGKPIAGVKVILVSPDGEKQEAATDGKGMWRLVNVRPGPWEVGFLAPGYEPRNFKINLAAAKENPPVNVKLARIPESPLSAADALYKDRKYEEALKEYQRILEAQPELFQASVQIGLCYYRLGELDQALASFEKALVRLPGSPEILINMAAIHLQRGELERGVQYIKQVDEKSLTDPSLFYNIGVLFFKEGQIDMAIEYLQKCLAVDGKHVDGTYQLGLAFLNKGQAEEAKKCFQRIMELAPGTEKADLARKILAGIR